MSENWEVFYSRPDGWWSAGDGFESAEEATQAAQEQLPPHVNWKVALAGPTTTRGDAVSESVIEDIERRIGPLTDKEKRMVAVGLRGEMERFARDTAISLGVLRDTPMLFESAPLPPEEPTP